MSLHQSPEQIKHVDVDSGHASLPYPERIRWCSTHEAGPWHEPPVGFDLWACVMDAYAVGFVAIRSPDLTSLSLIPAPTFADVWGQA